MVAVAVVAALPLAGPPAAGAALTQGRAILVSERFTPERGAKDNPLAHTLVAQPGERESLQAIVRVPANVARLHARVVPAVAGDRVLSASELALVGFVDVTRPTTAISRGAGSYADPLPPLGARGQPARRGRWNGVLVTFTVPRGTAPGTHAGPGGVLRRAPRLRRGAVHAARLGAEALSWEDPAAFKITIPVQVGPYVEPAPLSDRRRSASSAWSTSSASWPSTT